VSIRSNRKVLSEGKTWKCKKRLTSNSRKRMINWSVFGCGTRSVTKRQAMKKSVSPRKSPKNGKRN